MLHFQFFSQSHQPAANQAVGDFVSQRIWGEAGKFGPHCSMGVTNRDSIVAGVIYHNYQADEGTIEVSCAGDGRRWMTRAIIRAAISMPFDKLGCQAVVARHSEDARHIRHIWRSLGAREFVVPRLRGKDAPAEAIAVLTDDDWLASRWVRQLEGVA